MCHAKTKNKPRRDKHLLVTVSDKQGTRHFKVPKYIKPALISTAVGLLLLAITSSALLLLQYQRLDDTLTRAGQMEDAYVKLSARNARLNDSLTQDSSEKVSISEALARMEELSGISSRLNTPISDRIRAISSALLSRNVDIEGIETQNIRIETLASDTASAENQSITDQLLMPVELADLSDEQQKILHDSIPNGYPIRNLGTRSAFGTRTSKTNKESSFHNGTDLTAAEGSPIYATADGVVKQLSSSKLKGRQVVISHNYGFETRYARLSEIMLKPGDVVQKGDIIARSGSGGSRDGAYLHYEVRYLDKVYNPIDFLNWEFGSQEIFSKVRGIQWQSLISLINKQISRPSLQLSQLTLE